MAKKQTQRDREFAAASKIASALRGLRLRSRYSESATKRALRFGIAMAYECDTTEQENHRIGELLKVTE